MWNFEKKRAFAFLHNFGGKAGCLVDRQSDYTVEVAAITVPDFYVGDKKGGQTYGRTDGHTLI